MSLTPGHVAGAFVLVGLLVLALRRPLLAKFGLRQGTRRPKQLILIALGLMVATAVMAGAGVASDSIRESAYDHARAQLGETDVYVGTRAPVPLTRTQADAFLSDPTIAPLIAQKLVGLRWSASVVDARTDLGEPTVAVWGIDPAEFIAMGGLRGVSGEVPSTLAAWPANTFLVNQAMEKKIDAKVPDSLQLFVQPAPDPANPTPKPSVELMGAIAAVVSMHASDPLYTSFTPGPVVYVPLPRLQTAIGVAGGVNAALLKAAEGTTPKTLAKTIEDKVAAVAAANPNVPALVQVEPIRDQQMDRAKADADGMKVFFLTLGSFTIMAGLLLIVSLMAMLVDERKADLATMRATGAARFDLTQMHLHEGALYGVAATLLGVGVGIALATFIIWKSSTLFDGDFFKTTIHVLPATVLASAGAGFALTVAVVGIAAYRVSRFNIARGLRGEEEAIRAKRMSWKAKILFGLLVLVGALLSALAATSGDAAPGLLGPSLLILGAAGFLARKFDNHIVYPVVGGAVLAWVTASYFLFTKFEGDDDFLLVPVRGLLTAISATLVLVYLDAPAHAAAWLVRKIKRFDPVAAPAFAYARRRRGRTALTVAMIGLVLLVLVAVSTVFNMFQPAPGREAGGFDVVGTSREPILDPAAYLSAHPSAKADPLALADRVIVTPFAAGAARTATVKGGGTLEGWMGDVDVLGVTTQFVQQGKFESVRLEPGLADAKAALEYVLSHPDTTVTFGNEFQVQESVDKYREPRIGDVFEFPTASGTVSLRVVGVLQGSIFSSVFVNPETLAKLPAQVGSRFWVDAKGGEDATDVAKAFESAFRPAGMDARSVQEAIDESGAWIGTFLVIIQSFLGMGFVVGVASIGIVTARNVLERRREVGVLRALGAGEGHIVSIFLLEVLFVVTLGVIIGFGGGLLTAYASYRASFKAQGAEFDVNWLNLGIIVALAYLTAFLAAYLPARQASRVPPAQATRYVE